jgi:hypothetical protein
MLSRPYPRATNISQVPFIDIGVPTLESDVQPTTLIGESSDKKKSYEKNRKFLRLWLLIFPWA